MTKQNWNSEKLFHVSDITIEEVKRVLEAGQMLLAVLSDEEIEKLQRVLNGENKELEIGNAGVT